MYISCELIVLYSYLIRYSMEGPLAPYKQYTGANHHTAKLKPLVWCGIDFDAKAYIKAKTDGHEPTPLQELSFKIKCEAKGAQKAVDDKKAAEKEKNNKKRKKSEAAEVAMKIRDGPGVGESVNVPAGADAHTVNALQHLRRQPGASGKYIVCILIVYAYTYVIYAFYNTNIMIFLLQSSTQS